MKMIRTGFSVPISSHKKTILATMIYGRARMVFIFIVMHRLLSRHSELCRSFRILTGCVSRQAVSGIP